MEARSISLRMQTPLGLNLRPLKQDYIDALDAAESQLAQWRWEWEERNLIPTEKVPKASNNRRRRLPTPQSPR
jgi:hypothetical protein